MSNYKKALTWVGSKYKVLSSLIPILEFIGRKHGIETFVDVCIGGASVSVNIDKSIFSTTVANDIDNGLVALYTTLKSILSTEQLIELIDTLITDARTPKELIETAIAVSKSDENVPELTRAAYTFLSIYGSRFSYRKAFDSMAFKGNFILEKKHHDLYKYNSDFNQTIISCENLFDLIERHREDENVLLYMDVPYHPESMTSDNHYGDNTMSVEDHRKLITILNDPSIKMKWVVSGWYHSDYDALVKDGFNYYHTLGIYKYQSRMKIEYIWTNAVLDSSVEPELVNSKLDGLSIVEYKELTGEVAVKSASVDVTASTKMN